MRGRISNKERLGHIAECIGEINEATKGIAKETFKNNHVLRIAVVKWLEIIGEAANNLSNEIKEKSEIDWSEIIGFRHFVVHEYFGIDYELVWGVIENELGVLEVAIEKLQKEFE